MDTVRVLAYVPQCTDAAVEKLAGLAVRSNDAELLSDLAGAYYIRAERKNEPSDFVRALAAADRAAGIAPRSAIAPRFNRALAEEAIGFSEDARRSWDEIRHGAAAGWTSEAEKRHAALAVQHARSAAIQWPLNVTRLPERVRAGDARTVRHLVAPYRGAARRYVEEDVLTAWAAAFLNGRPEEAAEQLRLATMVAKALAQLMDDAYLLDAVNLLHSGKPAVVATLARAQLRYRDARNEERALHREVAGVLYEEAAKGFAAAGSPLRFGAMLGQASGLTVANQFDRAFALFRTVERQERRQRYPSVLARVHAGRGFAHYLQGRHLDAIADYTEAQKFFEQTKDNENISNTVARQIGMFLIIGNEKALWREAFPALRHAGSIFEAQSRHVLFGEAADATVALGYPAIALRFQNVAVRLLEDELSHNTDDSRVEGLRINLGVALRARAAIRVRLRDNLGAQADLDTAIPLIGKPKDPREVAIPSGMRARLAEVQAQTLPASERPKAIAKLGEAIREASSTHYRTLIASLYIERAGLYRLDGNRAAARADLEAAIAALRKEEQAVLLGRGRLPESERLWSAYFSRFQEAYRELIRYVIDDGGDAEAFAYAERARAYELLQLVLQRTDVPPQFRAATPDGEPLGIEAVRKSLPAATYLLEFVVLDDRTYVWILRRDGPPERRMLPVRESDIRGWTSALQSLASQRDVERFQDALAAPYQALFQEAIGRVAALQRGAPARVVIVPDRSMHGLPFAALRRRTRYLIQDYAVAVAPSATLYTWALAQDEHLSHTPLGSFLVVDDPKFNAHLDVAGGLPPLHGTQREAMRIRSVYAPVMHVDERKEENATVAEFLRLAPGSTITHIAAHGVANPDVPSRSFLLLAPTENDSGTLDAERLLTGLRLKKTRLFVLSSCSSAGGMPVGPEGLAPLVRPLVAAGVPGVVGTLWNVGENSATAEVLVRFHQHYREGNDAADALRLAQLDMLGDSDLERSSVVAWAPFQMVGYASSPFPVH